MNIYIIIFISLFFVGLVVLFKFRKKKYKISLEKLNFINKQLKRILLSKSYKEQIIDIDKLYHKVLLEGGYMGTFGEILKLKPSEIQNLNKIWELHKLRNKLVHDFDLLSESVLSKRAFEYKKEIQKLIMQYK